MPNRDNDTVIREHRKALQGTACGHGGTVAALPHGPRAELAAESIGLEAVSWVPWVCPLFMMFSVVPTQPGINSQRPL